MKKIIISLLLIVITLTMVTVSASALFSSTASVSGVTFASGSASLKIDDNAGHWTTGYGPGNLVFANMYPGYTNFQPIHLKNESSTNIKFTLGAQLSGGLVSDEAVWNLLKDKIQMRITNADGTVAKTSWRTLAYWDSTNVRFDTSLAQNEDRYYRVEVTISKTYGNEISDKTLSNLTMTFSGIQE